MTGQLIALAGDRKFCDISDGGRAQPAGVQRLAGNVVAMHDGIKRTRHQTEANQQSPILPIAFGPTRIVRSNWCSSWHGILLERHIYSPGERTSASIDRHVISMSHGSPFRFEHRTLSGEFLASLTRQRTIMISPAGPVPDVRLHTPAEFIHCAFEEGFTHRVLEELDHPAAKPIFRAGLQDRSIQRIMLMLLDELETEHPLGRLYVDSLAHVLATRYLLLDVGTNSRSQSRVTGLVPRILSRIREKIEANLEADLSLESLAEESGYSRAHFLRAFQAATGLTPHRYVLDLRLKRAQERLKQANSSIIDVAVCCGFSSQSYMTSVFRRQLETTPGEYRRNARSFDAVSRQHHSLGGL
jgi:AraC family transcriptional regulator